jgi:hypothetical protein
MPQLNRPDWSTKLTRSLTLKDGTKLVTLADARALPEPPWDRDV